MINKLRLPLVIWGIISLIIVTFAIIFLLNKPQETPLDPTDDPTIIPIDLLSDQEQSSIKTTSKAILEAFLTQSTSEPATSRELRLAPYITSDNTILRAPLGLLESYTSLYTLPTSTTATVPGDIIWSEVSPTSVSVYAKVDIAMTDQTGFSDIAYQNWFVILHKVNDKWLAHGLEKGPNPPPN